MKLIDKKMSPYSKANQLTKKIKFTALSACMTTLICASVSGYASDSEIYVVPATTPGKTTIMFMLDISDICRAPAMEPVITLMELTELVGKRTMLFISIMVKRLPMKEIIVR